MAKSAESANIDVEHFLEGLLNQKNYNICLRRHSGMGIEKTVKNVVNKTTEFLGAAHTAEKLIISLRLLFT